MKQEKADAEQRALVAENALRTHRATSRNANSTPKPSDSNPKKRGKGDQGRRTTAKLPKSNPQASNLAVAAAPTLESFPPGTWIVTKNKNFELHIKSNGSKEAFKNVKFLASPDEVKKVLARVLEESLYGDRLRALRDASPALYDQQIEQFYIAYGTIMAQGINTKRNNVQQAVKKVWEELRKSGLVPKAKELIKVACRKRIQVLEEEDEDGNPIQANIDRNLRNKKYRDLFDLWVGVLIPCTLGHEWKEEHFTQVAIGSSKSPVTAADEAMLLLTIDNCEKKWEIEHGKTFPHRSNYTNPVDRKDLTAPQEGVAIDKTSKHHKKWLKKLHNYSSCSSGNSIYGGWSLEGRLQFHKVKVNIQKARKEEGVRQAEVDCCARLYEKHDMAKKLGARKQRKAAEPKIDLRRAALAFSEEAEELDLDLSDEEEEAPGAEEEGGATGEEVDNDDGSEVTRGNDEEE